MANGEDPTSLRAIQIITTEDNVGDGGRSKIIKVIEKWNNEPSLQDVFVKNNHDLPIFVFSITGKTRGGKSFLLNLMIKYLESQNSGTWHSGRLQNVFEWQGGVESVTKGIWICPKIYKRRNSDGKQVGILLLDNQGLFDGEQTDGESAALSGISTTFSYYQMFNLKEKITTQDLETIWRNIVFDMDDPGAAVSNTRLLFTIRDFLAEEEGCGLEKGQVYLDKEKIRGSEEHKSMWKSLQEIFPNIQCLLLPHPGLAVARGSILRESGNMADIRPEFLNEIRTFFEAIFSPSNLTTTKKNCFTGNQIYNMLQNFKGKRANDNLSFINLFTEHGNEDKLQKSIKSFETKVKYTGDPTMLKSLMGEFLTLAKKQFKGKSAPDFLAKLKKEMSERVNHEVKEWIVKNYKYSLQYTKDVKLFHPMIWRTVIQRRSYFVTTGPDQDFTQAVVEECAAHYYRKLREDLESLFILSCGCKSLEELEGYDDIFVSDRYRENDDFKGKVCKAVWLKERQTLQESVQHELLKKVSELTKKDILWLKDCSKAQYEYFNAFTIVTNADVGGVQWIEIEKNNEERLLKVIGYAVYKKSQNISEFSKMEVEKIKEISEQMKTISPYSEIIKLSCIFIIYQNEEKLTITDPIFGVENPKEKTSFVDKNARAYQDWQDFAKNNKLPDCLYCYPLRGEYNKATGFRIAFAWSPATDVGRKILSAFDIVEKVVSLASGVALGAAATVVTSPALLLGGAVAAIGSGTYGFIRGVVKVVDKSSHRESVSIGDVSNLIGSGLSVATGGVSAAVSFLTNTAREAIIAGTVVQGLSSVTKVAFEFADDIGAAIAIANDVSDIALLFFKSNSFVEIIDTIRSTHRLESDVSPVTALKSLVCNNSTQAPIESGSTLEIENFFPQFLSSLILELFKLQKPEDSETPYHMMFLSKLFSSERCNFLKKALDNASEFDQNQFFQLLMKTVLLVFAKPNISVLRGQRSLVFQPTNDVLEQIDVAAAIIGHNNQNQLEKQTRDKLNCVFEKILTLLCEDANKNWELSTFKDHLIKKMGQIVNSFC